MLFKKVNTNKISKKEITLIVLAMSALAFLFSLYSNPDWFESKLTGLSSVGEQDGVEEETKNNVPEINELKITPDNFVFDKVSALGLNISANDQDGISDLAEQAVVYLLDKEMSDRESAYAYVNSVNGFNTCESLNGLPCQISLSGPDRSGNYEGVTDFLPNKIGTLSYLVIVTDKQVAATYELGKFMVEEASTMNNAPTISKKYPLSPSEFEIGLESTALVSVEAMDADGVKDLNEQASFYLFNKSFSSEKDAQEAVQNMETNLKDYTCNKAADLPCKLTISSTTNLGSDIIVYKGTASFKASVLGEKSFLAVVKDKQDATAYSLGTFLLTQKTPQDNAPEITSHKVEKPNTFTVGEENSLSVQMTAYDADNDLLSFAPIYFFDEVIENIPRLRSWEELTNYFEEQGLETTFPKCSKTQPLPCSTLINQNADTESVNYSKLVEFSLQETGKKTYLLLATDNTNLTDSVSGTFELTETTPENNAPSVKSFSLTPAEFESQDNFALVDIKTSVEDLDESLDLSEKALVYFLDKYFSETEAVSSAYEYVKNLKTIPDCNSTTAPPCKTSLSRDNSGISKYIANYSGTSSFMLEKTGNFTAIVIASDKQGAEAYKNASYLINDSPAENSRPQITNFNLDPHTFETWIIGSTNVTISATDADGDDDLANTAEIVIFEREFSSVETVLEIMAEDPDYVLYNCDSETTLPCRAYLNGAPNYAGTVDFSTEWLEAGPASALAIVRDQQGAVSYALTSLTLEASATGNISLRLSVPLQDRDNNPATDRGDNSTEIWFGLYSNTASNPIYTTKVTSNADGEASVSISDFELGSYIAVVKTSQHLSKAINATLTAGENQITFPYLFAGDIAGNRNQVATGTFDDLVNSVDIGEIYLYWGVKRSQTDYNYIPDLDGNGEIGAEDFSTLISNAGKQGDLANK